MGGAIHERSQVVGGYQRVRRTIATAYRQSHLQCGIESITTAARHSSLITWLTEEPDPHVIVIDLRETYTVGLFIRLLDGLAPNVRRVWNASFIQRSLASTSELINDVPVKVASVLLLGFILFQSVRIVPAWQETSPLTLGALALALIVALAGLRVDRSLEELAESRAGDLARTLLAPPEPPDEDQK